MSDYFRRVTKFILYLAVIFVLVLGVAPLLFGQKPKMTFNEILHNQRMVLFLAFLLAYAMVYPLVAFVKVKRHLNGTFAENREHFEKAFSTLEYIKIKETEDCVVFRKKSKLTRLIQWYEDSITVFTGENPVIISGMRKPVTRIDTIIDQLLRRSVE